MSRIQTVQVGEHILKLPPLPKRKEEILFWDKKKEDAFWQRLEFPALWYDYNDKTKSWQHDTVYDDDGVLISLSYDDSELLKKLLLQENKRRKKGVWMKNGDDYEHIVGGYYYTLQWCQMKDLPTKYGTFRKPQNNLMRLWEHVKHDVEYDWCSGLIIPKTKKSGMTQIIALDFLNEATLNSGWEIGMISKEYDHAVNVPMAYLFHAYDNLPYILQPDVRKRNEHEIVFGRPVPRVGTKGATRRDKKAVLNTRVSCSKTKPTGFDGPVMRLGLITEMPKTWEASKVSPDALHKKVRETVRIQQKKNGALIYESYMPEIDDRGFEEFREICKQSQLSTRNSVTGRTESGMIVAELTAVDSNEVCFDKYGNCDRGKALMLINAENDSLKKTSDKQAHRRQYPRDRNDMYDSGGRGTVFDNLKLAIVKRELEALLATGMRPWAEGHLRWVNSMWESDDPKMRRKTGEFSSVYLERMTEEELIRGEEGSFRMFYDLPDKLLNQVVQRNVRDEEGKFLTPYVDTPPIVAGCDPTDYALKRDVQEGSKVACIGGYLPDPALDTLLKKQISDLPAFEYDFRHDNPDDDLEMIIKIILFMNVRMIIEANKKWLITALKREGLQNFLLLKHSDGSIKPYTKGDEMKLVSTDHKMIDIYVRSIKRWAGNTWYAGKYPSLRALEEGMEFDPTQTKKFNMMVALGYWRVAVDSYSIFRLEELERQSKYDGEAMEEAYDLLEDL